MLSKKFLEKSISAMVSAIEIYNKPNAFYRSETFCVLAINGWELLIKSKLLEHHQEDIEKIYILDSKNESGFRVSRAGNPCTIELMGGYKELRKFEPILLNNPQIKDNIEAIIEYRDSATHGIIEDDEVEKSLQELGTACLQNYFKLVNKWFGPEYLEKYNFYLMPLAFFSQNQPSKSCITTTSENLIKYLKNIQETDINSEYTVFVGVDVKLHGKNYNFTDLTIKKNEQSPIEVSVLQVGIPEQYNLTYKDLISRLKGRYLDFSQNKIFRGIMKTLEQNTQLCFVNKIDPKNPKTQTKKFYSGQIIGEFDKHYTKIK